MGDETTIRLPKTLRDRLNVLIANEARKQGKQITQADWIEKHIKEDEKQ